MSTVAPTKEAEKNGVEERGDEVVVGVPDTGEPLAQEHAGTRTLDTVQHPASIKPLQFSTLPTLHPYSLAPC
jgi:glutamine phosphoribosylpyrophosphate amidotransferase